CPVAQPEAPVEIGPLEDDGGALGRRPATALQAAQEIAVGAGRELDPILRQTALELGGDEGTEVQRGRAADERVARHPPGDRAGGTPRAPARRGGPRGGASSRRTPGAAPARRGRRGRGGSSSGCRSPCRRRASRAAAPR